MTACLKASQDNYKDYSLSMGFVTHVDNDVFLCQQSNVQIVIYSLS